MISIGLGGIISAFELAYNLAKSKPEKERLSLSVISAMKKFKFFYEDIEWNHIRNADAYRPKLASMADEMRTISVQIDGKLDDDIIKDIRSIAANLDTASSENLPSNTFSRASGESLKKRIEASYDYAKSVISKLEE